MRTQPPFAHAELADAENIRICANFPLQRGPNHRSGPSNRLFYAERKLLFRCNWFRQTRSEAEPPSTKNKAMPGSQPLSVISIGCCCFGVTAPEPPLSKISSNIRPVNEPPNAGLPPRNDRGGEPFWDLEKAQFVGVVADQEVLCLLIVVQHHLMVFTTNP